MQSNNVKYKLIYLYHESKRRKPKTQDVDKRTWNCAWGGNKVTRVEEREKERESYTVGEPP